HRALRRPNARRAFPERRQRAHGALVRCNARRTLDDDGRPGLGNGARKARESARRSVVLVFLIGRTAMQKITPFLWFDFNAEEAMNFYVSVFEHAKVGKITR